MHYTHRVKHVLWELRPRTYWPTDAAGPINEQLFPAYLYNENRLDDLRYVFNIDTLKLSWQLMNQNKNLFSFNPDTLGYWADYSMVPIQHDKFNSQENLNDLLNQQRMSVSTYKKNTATLDYPTFDDNVFPVLNEWCNTG